MTFLFCLLLSHDWELCRRLASPVLAELVQDSALAPVWEERCRRCGKRRPAQSLKENRV